MSARPRRPGRSAVALLLGGLAAAGCGEPSRPVGVRNVLLISLDSVRADELTFLDPEVSPHLAGLAGRGTRFTQALSGTSWTLPAHVQMFTGQPPSLSRVEVDSVRIDSHAPVLTEGLERAGYTTLGFWTGWYLAPSYGFGRGFQLYRNGMSDGERRARELEDSMGGGSVAGAIEIQNELELQSHQDVTSGQVAELVSAALTKLEADSPLFLFAHLFDPHYDYVPPGEWARRFDPDYTGSIDGVNYWGNPAIWDPERNQRTCSERDLAHIRALYRGEIGWTDENIGRLLAELEALGRLDDTLIVVTSDHGEEFFDHGGRGHRASLYDEVLRVPLLVVLPAALRDGAPAQVDAQVSLSDILPTIYDFAGIETPAGVAGRSLRPALEGREFPSLPAVSSLQVQASGPDGSRALVLHEAVRTPQEKFLRMTVVTPGQPVQIVGLQWFDLVADPLEQHPLPGTPQQLLEGDARVRSGWKRLEQGLARLRKLAAGQPRQSAGERSTDMAQHLERELRQLGYVDATGSGANAAGLLPDWGLDVRPAMPLRP